MQGRSLLRPSMSKSLKLGWHPLLLAEMKPPAEGEGFRKSSGDLPRGRSREFLFYADSGGRPQEESL